MKIIRLVKSEFIKNWSFKKFIFIVLVMSIFSIGVVFYNVSSSKVYYSYNYSSIGYDLDVLESIDDRTIEQEYYYRVNVKYKENGLYAYNNSIKDSDWRNIVLVKMSDYVEEYYLYEIYLEYYDELQNICDTYDEDNLFEIRIHNLCMEEEKEIEDDYERIKDETSYLENIIKENKFYLYIEYLMDNDLIEEDCLPIAKVIVNKKETDSDGYLVLNYLQYNELYEVGIEDEDNVTFVDDDFSSDKANLYGFINYDNYVRYYTKWNSLVKEYKQIILYSSTNGISHDLNVTALDVPYYYGYSNTKTVVNNIYHYIIVVMVLVAITCSGIVSREHENGTIKNIITAPVRRWKILLSKFIYLILYSYIILLIGLVVLSVVAGIKYGFSDLFMPKLIYTGGVVKEVNYYLYLFKELFIAGIPMIFFLSIILLLSTISSTSFTTGLTSIMAILTPVYWYVASNYKLLFLAKTPLLYFDLWFIKNNHEWYRNIYTYYDMTITKGVVMSFVLTIIVYFITNIIYVKKDIK